jgi:hypothetical protein
VTISHSGGQSEQAESEVLQLLGVRPLLASRGLRYVDEHAGADALRAGVTVNQV